MELECPGLQTLRGEIICELNKDYFTFKISADVEADLLSQTILNARNCCIVGNGEDIFANWS